MQKINGLISAYRFYRSDYKTFPSWRLPRWRALLGALRFARTGAAPIPANLKSFRVADRIYAALYKS